MDTVALPASADGGEGFTFNLPAIITDTHHEAGERFMEFFASTIELKKVSSFSAVSAWRFGVVSSMTTWYHVLRVFPPSHAMNQWTVNFLHRRYPTQSRDRDANHPTRDPGPF